MLPLDLLEKTICSKQMLWKTPFKKSSLALTQWGGHVGPVETPESMKALLLCKSKSVVKRLWTRHLPRVTQFVRSLLLLPSPLPNKPCFELDLQGPHWQTREGQQSGLTTEGYEIHLILPSLHSSYPLNCTPPIRSVDRRGSRATIQHGPVSAQRPRTFS